MEDLLVQLGKLSFSLRLTMFAAMAIVTHLLVILVRHVATTFLTSQPSRRYQKLRSIATLATSAIVFTLYFLAIGLILREFGVSLTAYLASASVVGLAIGFGSQGIVQDVVTGLTFIFSDLVDVGDLVEVSGQSGFVRAITMRFVEIENAMGATVYIPNRTITNITNYPRGYIRCIADITLRGDEDAKNGIETVAIDMMQATYEQFRGILLTKPTKEGRISFSSGKEVLRIKFRIWPGRGGPIETTFLQELVAELRKNDPEYQPWMISISYEVEERKLQRPSTWPWRPRFKQ